MKDNDPGQCQMDLLQISEKLHPVTHGELPKLRVSTIKIPEKVITAQ